MSPAHRQHSARTYQDMTYAESVSSSVVQNMCIHAYSHSVLTTCKVHDLHIHIHTHTRDTRNKARKTLLLGGGMGEAAHFSPTQRPLENEPSLSSCSNLSTCILPLFRHAEAAFLEARARMRPQEHRRKARQHTCTRHALDGQSEASRQSCTAVQYKARTV